MAGNKGREATAKPKATHHGGVPDPEDLDRTPLELPLGSCRPRTVNEIVAMMLQQHIDRGEQEGHETWDEANDFDLEEDDLLLPLSQYELQELRPDESGYEVEGETDKEPETAPEAPQETIPADPSEAEGEA